MSELFGIDIATEVSNAFSGQLLDATLTRENPGNYDPDEDDYFGGGADSTYTTQGIVDKYEDRLIAEGIVQENDRRILLIAKDLGTDPSPGSDGRPPDKITIEGKTYTVVGIPERDPAGATWTVQGRL